MTNNEDDRDSTVAQLEKHILQLMERGYKREALKLIQSATEGESELAPIPEKDGFDLIRKYCHEQMKVVGIHQPNYFPWLGYFHKIYYSDIFVFLDDVQIGQRSFVNRVFIRNKSGKNYLRIPLIKHHRTDKIQDVYPFQDEWKQQNIALLKYYKNYPCFDEYFPQIELMILKCDVNHSISEINIRLIREMCGLLNIESEFIKSSTLNILSTKAQRMIDITKALNGTIYLSGAGAEKYQKDISPPKDVKIVYQEIYNFLNRHPYHSLGLFINGLSVIDALFCVGANGILKIFDAYTEMMTGNQNKISKHASQ
jgi:hypothetical protein